MTKMTECLLKIKGCPNSTIINKIKIKVFSNHAPKLIPDWNEQIILYEKKLKSYENVR